MEKTGATIVNGGTDDKVEKEAPSEGEGLVYSSMLNYKVTIGFGLQPGSLAARLAGSCQSSGKISYFEHKEKEGKGLEGEKSLSQDV
eukprot:1159390-Pelagomonas_calceolata.AAC.1